MRCPKCGYISFDHLENCLKCHKDIKATSIGLFGSTYNIQPPTFLRLDRQQKEQSSGQRDLFESQAVDEVDEYVDEELEILIEDEDSDMEGQIAFGEDEKSGLRSADADEQEEDGEIEIDFSRFEDADDTGADLVMEDMTMERAFQEKVAPAAPAIEIPDELVDISDLAPPAKGPKTKKQPAESPADSGLSDLELEDLYFDLGLDDVDESRTGKPGAAKESILALDDIDFSETLGESRKDSLKKAGGMDLDLDLDFDLDLGGLSIHKDV
jgi:hypothetical protein